MIHLILVSWDIIVKPQLVQVVLATNNVLPEFRRNRLSAFMCFRSKIYCGCFVERKNHLRCLLFAEKNKVEVLLLLVFNRISVSYCFVKSSQAFDQLL